MIFKNVLFAILVCLEITCCSSTPVYKQMRIPLNINNGIPFYKDEIDYKIDGFEVDSQGNFYFLGAIKTTLAVYSGTRLKYRTVYNEFKANKLFVTNNKLYVLDNSKNNLYVLDVVNGKIIQEYDNIIKNKINSFEYLDSTIVAEIFDMTKKIDMSTKLAFVELSLTGRLLKQVDNRFNLPNLLYPKQFEDNSIQFMGKWNNAFLFMSGEMDKGIYKFWLQNSNGKIISTASIKYNTFGEIYYGNPTEHRKLRNGNIYILGREGANALITELPLKELFSQNH